ncbi:MAG: hypothetical protein ACOX4U_07410 [Anaerovoracaceae bacterium]|jgi:hypothetical protein
MLKEELYVMLFTVIILLPALAGWYLIFGREVYFFAKEFFKGQGGRGGNNPVDKWVSKSLATITGKSINPRMLYLISGFVFLGMMVVFNKNLSLLSSLSLAIAGGLLPFAILYLRLETMRRKGSHEGIPLMTEFLRQYRITGGNIYETLEGIVNSTGRFKVSRKLIFTLLLQLRGSGDPAKIRQNTDAFSYGTDTNWGRMLAHNIYLSATAGIDISMGLEDILIQLRDAAALAEERKRLNSESVKMTVFMVPFTYLITGVMAVRYLDTPMWDFMDNQFRTSQGLLMFMIIGLLFLFNLFAVTFITNQKFDF